jgi:hypothetical protein
VASSQQQAPIGYRASKAAAALAVWPPQAIVTEAVAGGAEGDVDTEAEGTGKPFLRRRSKAVAAKKLDWSHVKPRTVTSRC